MTETARRGRPRDTAKDDAVLDATIEELRDHGTSELSIERVAARAGVAKTTVYRRWSNADELSLAALRRYLDDDSPPPDLSGPEQVLFLADRTRRTWADETYAAIMRRVAADGSAHPELYRAARDRLIGTSVAYMDDALRRCVDEGAICADTHIDTARRLIIGPIVSAAFTLRSGMTRAEVERSVEIVLRGLAP